MKISLGNAIYNHKPTKEDMVWRSGFQDARKNPIACPILEDTAQNYAFAFANGLCVKGYKFTSIDDIYKRTFICDFDNLTKEQYEWIVERTRNCGLKTIAGDDSSGMKIDKYKNKANQNWKPKKWKYKVFFPLDEYYGNRGVVCTREQVEKAYYDVVGFFNPNHSMDEVKTVGQSWLKANNQSIYYKHGKKEGQLRKNHPSLTIEDPMFTNWILPDPVEVTNPRHQITYAVVPQMKEDCSYLSDDDWKYILKRREDVPKYTPSSKFNFCSEVYLPYDMKSDIEAEFCGAWQKRRGEFQLTDAKKRKWETAILKELATKTDTSTPLSIPTSKSEMAKRTGKYNWGDLTFDHITSAKVNMAIYTEWEGGYDMGDIADILKNIVKFLVRCEAEVERETGNLKQDTVASKVIKDTPVVMRKVFNDRFVDEMDEKKRLQIAKQVARNINYYTNTFNLWRKQAKWGEVLKRDEFKDEWKQIRTRYLSESTKEGISDTRLKEVQAQYDQERKLFYKKVDEEAKLVTLPYKYTRRGLKKEMVTMALNHGAMNKEAFTNLVMEAIVDQDGMVEIERVEKWYRYYQSQYNKNNQTKVDENDICADIINELGGMVLELDGRIHKQHKQHKSKYDYIFESGKTREEQRDLIASLNVNRVQKKRLLERWEKEWNQK